MNTTDLSTLSNHAINMIAIQQVQDFLSSTYVFRYNENTHRIVYKRISNDEEFHYLSDYEFNSILKDIKMANISCSRDLLRTVLFSDYVQKFNPFANYLNNLPDWDGTDYVSLLADSITTTDREYWLFCLRKWLVAMVASLKKKVLLIILQLFSLVRKVLAKQDGFIPLFLLNYKNSFMKGTFKPRIRKRK